MLTISFIRHFVSLHDELAYLFIIIGVIVEGEVAVILAGIFSNLGSLNIYFSFISVLLGGGIKSFVGYNIGLYLKNNHSHRPILSRAERRVRYFFPHFDKKPFWSLFASRFLILSLHFFSIIYAGYCQIKVKLFLQAEATSLLVWSMLMLGLGYTFSFTALAVSHDVRNFLGIIILCFVVFFLLEKVAAFLVELFNPEKED